MKDHLRPTSRLRVLMSAALRLGCALLACAGIAAASGAAAPADGAASLRLTLERHVAAVLDAARETGAAWTSPASVSIRRTRSSRANPFRSVAVPAVRRAGATPAFAIVLIDFTVPRCLFRAAGASTPRAPPASA